MVTLMVAKAKKIKKSWNLVFFSFKIQLNFFKDLTGNAKANFKYYQDASEQKVITSFNSTLVQGT